MHPFTSAMPRWAGDSGRLSVDGLKAALRCLEVDRPFLADYGPAGLIQIYRTLRCSLGPWVPLSCPDDNSVCNAVGHSLSARVEYWQQIDQAKQTDNASHK